MKRLLLLIVFFQLLHAQAQKNYLLVGTYTNGKSEGIYLYTFNTATGKAELKSKIGADNPSYLAVAADGRHFYAVKEEGQKKGAVGAYNFNKNSGELTFIDEQLSGGDHPCYVSIDKTGKWVAVANYTGGSLSIFPVLADGRLGNAHQTIQHTGSSVNKQRQEKAHVHCTYFSPDNRFLLVSDLGMDKLMIYSFDQKTGQLSPAPQPFVPSPDNGGPRHIIFAPNNRYVYLMEELSGKVVAFAYRNGRLDTIQTISAARPGFTGFMGSADIHVSADGRFLYCSNRGDANTITIFRINPSSGKLSVAGFQSTMGIAPRNFNLDPSGKWLLVANQNSDNIIVFKRNAQTGLLTETGNKIEVGSPVCLKWIQ